MLPDRCSVTEHARQCVNPPEFIVSIIADDGQYMVGVTCGRHREIVSSKITQLQRQDRIRGGKISFEPVRAVGTDCIKGGADDMDGGRCGGGHDAGVDGLPGQEGPAGGLIQIGGNGDPKD